MVPCWSGRANAGAGSPGPRVAIAGPTPEISGLFRPGWGLGLRGGRARADENRMEVRSPAQFLHQRVREMSVSVVLLVAEAALLAVAGFWWWPAAVASFVPLFVLGRAAKVGGRLDSVRLQRGIEGEERVAALLDSLQPEGITVIHDLEIGRGNADHVLVGPTGVFVVETKDWGGRF